MIIMLFCYRQILSIIAKF